MSSFTDTPGLWQEYRAGVQGRNTMEAYRAGLHGRSTRQEYKAGVQGRSIWQEYMAGVYGRRRRQEIWQEQCQHVYIQGLKDPSLGLAMRHHLALVLARADLMAFLTSKLSSSITCSQWSGTLGDYQSPPV